MTIVGAGNIFSADLVFLSAVGSTSKLLNCCSNKVEFVVVLSMEVLTHPNKGCCTKNEHFINCLLQLDHCSLAKSEACNIPHKKIAFGFFGPVHTFTYNKHISHLYNKFLPHSAPSWIFSLAENLASSILQDEATEWHDYVPAITYPPTHPPGV